MAQTQTGEGAGTNVLDVLDQRQPTAFYWKLTILACLGGFLFGYDTSNIGSALNFIRFPLSSFWLGYLVAGASLGAAAGAVLAFLTADRLGRKTLLIADALIYAVGSILAAVSPNAAVLRSTRPADAAARSACSSSG
jgi:SP family arabinose:H+ symporter-like MFS transporter